MVLLNEKDIIMYPETLDKPKFVFFKNIKYKLLSKGYYLSSYSKNIDRKKAKGLHVAIWEDFNKKEVTNGFHIHHIDGNSFNNDPHNLLHISAEVHRKMPRKIDREKVKIHLDRIRHKASKWHSSEEGIKWHVENGKNCVRKEITQCCVQCKKEFLSKRKSTYCSSVCGDKARYSEDLLKYKKERVCQFCKNIFITMKKHEFFKTRITCSYSCSSQLRWQNTKLKKEQVENA